MDDEDVILVAGDKNSPGSMITEFLATLPGKNRYIAPHEQERWAVSDALGWKCIQRRNIALLEAIELGADIVTTVDDDNIPTDHYFHDVDDQFNADGKRIIASKNGWYNPGEDCMPSVVHRGFPYSQRHIRPEYVITRDKSPRIGVVAGLWLGDPDIDATERMVNAPDVRSISVRAASGIVPDIGTWAPFNTQNTSIQGDIAELLFCWPGVGRFDDIWGSYLARAVMDELGYYTVYGNPVVVQERNPHDLTKDLEAEIFGYRWTDEVVSLLRSKVLDSSDTVADMQHELLRHVLDSDRVPFGEYSPDFADAWHADVCTARGI